MPAGLPGSTAVENAANPDAGRFVMFDAMSGPKGSPFDKDNTGNASTGALSTGIGFGAFVINVNASANPATAAQAIKNAGFTDDVGPGGGVASSTMVYIGGGRSVVTAVTFENPPGVAGTNPYTAGFNLCGAGNGGSRDGGAGPAFTGFVTKMVTAAGAVAAAGVVETGFVNRSGVALVTTDSVLGSASAAQAAAS